MSSNTSSFFFVVGLDGIKDLSDEETSPVAHGALSRIIDKEPRADLSDDCDEILQASLGRTVPSSATEFPVYRVNGSGPSSWRPKANNRARK